MGHYKVTFLYCDEDDCEEVFDGTESRSSLIAEVRRDARKAGWLTVTSMVHERPEDFCPDHAIGHGRMM